MSTQLRAARKRLSDSGKSIGRKPEYQFGDLRKAVERIIQPLEKLEKRLMRHADIRTAMNVYGTVVTNEMSTAAGKVARLVCSEPGLMRDESNSTHEEHTRPLNH